MFHSLVGLKLWEKSEFANILHELKVRKKKRNTFIEIENG